MGKHQDSKGRFDDAALFVMEDFLKDTETAAYNLTEQATKRDPLKNSILAWYAAHPPITGGFRVTPLR